MPTNAPDETVDPSEGGAILAPRDRTAASAPVGISGGYQPALDGIRAIAVVLVMVFHIGLDLQHLPFGGGWLGVDMFFVLSGYLITSLLLVERRRTGRTNLRNFYVRRLLRLAPLSILLVAMCWIGQRVGLMPSLGLVLPTKGALSILFYFANWMQLRYPSSGGSLGHAWSLSIEEQFYLIWPAVVIGAFSLAKRNARWVLVALTVGGTVACGLYRRHLWYQVFALGPAGNPTRAWMQFFLSSFQRPDGLLVGCFLALVLHGVHPSRLIRVIANGFGIGGAIVATLIIGHASFPVWTPWVRFVPAWGLSALNVTVAAVLAAVVLDPTSLGARALSIRPLRWLGRRAYGLYLLHPLVLVAVHQHTSRQTNWTFLLVTSVTLVLAAASFRWVETPFLRRKDRFSTPIASEPAA